MRSQHITQSLLLALTLLGVLLLGLARPNAAYARPCVGLLPEDDETCEWQWQKTLSMRRGVITYTVQSGDTLWAIAARFNLDVDTLRYSNPAVMRNPDVLSIGQQLRILPFLGAIHKVKAGETLASIAKHWNVDPGAISSYGPNRIVGQRVKVGQELVIPGGYLSLNIPPPDPSPQTTFAWPLRGWFTQGYSARHRAVDIATSYGATVYAAGDGVVARAGWLFTGYGYSVIIRHGNGLQTLYSHLKGPLVSVGQWVRRGQPIGKVGSTGRSTGPHIHFEVRKDGVRVDPLPYLPPLPPQ